MEVIFNIASLPTWVVNVPRPCMAAILMLSPILNDPSRPGIGDAPAEKVEPTPLRFGPPRPRDPARLAIRVAAAKREYRPMEPIPLEIIVSNVSETERVRIHLNQAIYPTVQIVVTDSKGVEVAKTRRSASMSILGYHRTHSIAAGTTYKPKLVANLVNDMTDDEEYTIVVKVPYWSNANEEVYRTAVSEPITVRVAGEPWLGP